MVTPEKYVKYKELSRKNVEKIVKLGGQLVDSDDSGDVRQIDDDDDDDDSQLMHRTQVDGWLDG